MFLSDELIVSLVSLGVLAISEVLPLLPVEANGILEGFLLLFKACKRSSIERQSQIPARANG